MSEPDNDDPIFAGYHVVQPDGQPQTAVYCQLCNSIHLHGADRDLEVGDTRHKVAHCARYERMDSAKDIDAYNIEIQSDDIFEVKFGKHNTGPIIMKEPAIEQ